mmetsp:Transcript_6772/g.41353  ORF Transcript_6772/g.41353 Transcript_6772/m.41353 type:complete len:121 (+) Transcript_6772:2007-2369(+)
MVSRIRQNCGDEAHCPDSPGKCYCSCNLCSHCKPRQLSLGKLSVGEYDPSCNYDDCKHEVVYAPSLEIPQKKNAPVYWRCITRREAPLPGLEVECNYICFCPVQTPPNTESSRPATLEAI